MYAPVVQLDTRLNEFIRAGLPELRQSGREHLTSDQRVEVRILQQIDL